MHRDPPGHVIAAHGRGPSRRRVLGCCAGAAAGLFTSLAPADEVLREPLAAPWPARADEAAAHDDPWRDDPAVAALLARTFNGLDPAALWDAHAHLLGIGDGGSGCRLHPHLSQWWHPVESLRRRVIMGAAGVADAPGAVDEAYLRRLRQLAGEFPVGARWLLYAFEQAHDEAGRPRPDWSTFVVPDAYAAAVARAEPARFAWVASIHPYREDALAALEHAAADGALAVKWLPSAMNIDLRAPRVRPFYDRLAALALPLIVHGGEERAVPGAGRDELGNPLHVRAALECGVQVIVAHCASLGEALDLDARRPGPRPAFELFARLMDEPTWRGRLLGDVSAVFQANRSPTVWRAVLARTEWHDRLLHGSDYPLPGVGPLYAPGRLVRAGLLAPEDEAPLQRLRGRNPLLFDLALKRLLRADGRGLGDGVFDTRAQLRRRVSSVSPDGTV